MADDDEVDVLGDFNLENLLTKDENRLGSCYDGGVGSDLLQCDYQPSWYMDVGSPPWYERSQLESFSPLPFSLPLSSSPNNLQWNEPTAGASSGAMSAAAASWTEKERSLLEEGLELFGRSWSRLSQFVGTKSSHQIKNYLKMVRPTSESEMQSVSVSSGGDGTVVPVAESNISYSELIDDMQIPASMEEVIAVVSTAKPTVITNLPRVVQNADPVGSVFKRKKEMPAQLIKSKRGPGRPPRASPQKSTQKRSRGRPRKIVATGVHEPNLDVDVNVISELTETPRLGEEVVRIRREGSHSSDESDIEIDIEDFEGAEDENKTEDNQETVVIPVEKKESPSKSDVVPEVEENPTISADKAITDDEISSEVNIEDTCLKADSDDNEVGLDSGMQGKEGKPLLSNQDILDQIYKLPPPTSECVLGPDEITDGEKSIHTEFFEGRPAKTPKRYLKIRNHIIGSWLQNRPTYVTKTSTRTGLRNCGDVNCVGRIHAYLERIGAINFGCEQTRYHTHISKAPVALQNKPGVQGKPSQELQLQCMEGMRPRKKKQEIDENVLESEDGGYTIEHAEDGESTLTYNAVIKPKTSKVDSSIKLLYCAKFSNEKPAPFTVHLHIEALLVVDIHAHCSPDAEVMGLLGGELRKDSLHIVRAVSCRSSLSSSTHCDMCPVSQSEASDVISKEGLSVVGWYHSHPTFMPNPSLQDLSTQAEMQRWFSDTTAAPFVGLILSPYDPNSISIASQLRVLIVDPEGDSGGTPYRFPVNIVSEDTDVEELLAHMEETVATMVNPKLDKTPYVHSSGSISHFQKCLESIRLHLESCRPPLAPKSRVRILNGIQTTIKWGYFGHAP